MDFVGALVGGAIDAYSQHSANKTNIKLAREQMAFQERMSSSEMQRRVADLKAAGLNPMLAGLNQQGASSAQGATTRVEPITRNTASTALAVQMQRAQLENMDAQTRLLRSQDQNVREDTVLKGATASRTVHEIQRVEHEVLKLAQEVKTAATQVDISEQDLRTRKLSNEQLEKLQPLIERIHKADAKAKELGLSQAEVDAKFAKELGEESKYIQLIRLLLGR